MRTNTTHKLRKLARTVLSLTILMSTTSCNDYLEIYPENVQPSDYAWQTKEDVEGVLMSGYYYLRESVIDNLIPWGELRAGCIYDNTALQRFEIRPTDKITNWASMYKIVNQANLVIANAAKAFARDDTYSENAMNSHLCEAYWQRALAYFYIVRNWRNAPLFTTPYERDDASFNIPVSSDTIIIAQIKKDLKTAIDLNAAKEAFDTNWETKGRATRWAIYALMADVCLWNKDFEECITYANEILNSTSASAPRFMSTPTHSSWFSIFNPGNSNESIFEVQWSHEINDLINSANTLPQLFSAGLDGHRYMLSQNMFHEFNSEVDEILGNMDNMDEFLSKSGRTLFGGYNIDSKNWDSYATATNGYVWKYTGGTTQTDPRTDNLYDPNFIIYRVADIKLMKAEALIMRHLGENHEDNLSAIDEVNDIRRRSNLPEREIAENVDLGTLIDYVMHERNFELVGEGKAWYDFLRLGRYYTLTDLYDFRKDFFLEYVIKYNQLATETRIRSVLSDENAWYLPINDSELKSNGMLVQNPYYN